MVLPEHDTDVAAVATKVRKLTTTVNILTFVCLVQVVWLIGISYYSLGFYRFVLDNQKAIIRIQQQLRNDTGR